jgi:hypothetical protein
MVFEHKKWVKIIPRDAYTFLEYHFFDKQGNAIKIKLRTPQEIGEFFFWELFTVSSFLSFRTLDYNIFIFKEK